MCPGPASRGAPIADDCFDGEGTLTVIACRGLMQGNAPESVNLWGTLSALTSPGSHGREGPMS